MTETEIEKGERTTAWVSLDFMRTPVTYLSSSLDRNILKITWRGILIPLNVLVLLKALNLAA